MGNIHSIDFNEHNSKNVYEYDNCAGCYKPVDEEREKYMEIVMPYGDHKKHIVLCEKCYAEAEKAGIF